MLIANKTEYALRALVDIARNQENKPVSRSGIAERQNIPLPYLTQVLRVLVNGGVLTSNRGPTGGYSLQKNPVDITVLDVVTLLQGPVSPANCGGNGGSRTACDHFSGCGLAGVWSQLKSANEDVLGQTSLQDIIKRSNDGAMTIADEVMPVAKLDCIGVPCPLPIVKISEKMRDITAGQALEVWADDEGSKADIPAWCMGTGNEFLGREEFGSQMKFLIRKTT
ncbi:MAG: Rrf2 family transcriptional regulator [Thermoleophilia bacterium]